MPTFDLYSCKLRLGGSVLNEVPKIGVTAPEVEVLRAIHGSDAVLDLKFTGTVDRDFLAERERINDAYAGHAANVDGQREKKLALIRNLFGNDRLPLPVALDEVVKEDDAKAAPARAAKAKQPAFAD